MTFERKALTSLLSAICLLASGDFARAQEEPKPEPAEKATETPPKGKEEPPAKETPAGDEKAPAKPEEEKPAEGEPAKPMPEEDDEAAAERKEADAGTPVARPVSSNPVQVYGWREWVNVGDKEIKLAAKLDTGALTSSIHAEEKELFERDGKKWVRFIVTDPGEEKSARIRIEAPLTRIARIKEPGGESETREVVRLNFTIGDRKLRADFTLNNRSNMLSPVLIGRSTIKELGWVDPSRAYLADQKVMR